jgi:hypothetical protein
MRTTPFSCCVVFIAFLGVAKAQNVVATSGSDQATPLVPHAAMVVFVPSDSNNLEDAAKNAAISGAEGRAITAVAARTIPIPVVGGFIGEQVIKRITKLFHKDRPMVIKGFNLAFVQSLSAGTILQKGDMSFTVPAQALQGASPSLLRLRPSVKDAARIVRGVRISTTLTNSAINPMTSQVLGVDQNAVACRTELRNGDVVLIPNSPLESGEYAIVLVSVQQDSVPVAGAVLWDFRLL